MKIVESVAEMQAAAAALRRAGRGIGFVPTMGYLHAGHSSLMKIARAHTDVVVASIFVNPTQFAPGEDLDVYPRDFARDENICRAEGVDIVFYPDSAEMYLPGHSVYVVEESLARGLCGRARPSHFRGVCTVVAKLFNIVQPDLAVFGEKDYQQLRVLQQMSRDMNFPVRIIPGPIVREPDGLALSSRNKYLTKDERAQALALNRSLLRAADLFSAGERNSQILRAEVAAVIRQSSLASIDYVELVDERTLKPIEGTIEPPALVALAVNFGGTRLIDNRVLR